MHRSNIIIKQFSPIKYLDSFVFRRINDRIFEEEQKEQITYNNELVDNKDIVSISYQIDTATVEKDMTMTRIIRWTNGTITNDTIII